MGWLRAAVLGANDGIVSTVSLVLGVAAAGVSYSRIVPNQPFDERMRDRDFEDTQVGEPAVKSKQRVMIGADVLRARVAGNGVIEHPTHA